MKAVQDVRDGRVDLDLRGTLSAAVPYVLPVAAASILAAIAIVVSLIYYCLTAAHAGEAPAAGYPSAGYPPAGYGSPPGPPPAV